MNARERVRQALVCRKPDRIPKALGFFDQSLAAIAPTSPEDYFDLDIRYVDFDPPHNQDDFRRYLDRLPADIHMGSPAQLRTYHEWNYHPERGSARPLSSIRSLKDLARHVLPNLSKSAPPRRTRRKGAALAFPGICRGRFAAPFGRRTV